MADFWGIMDKWLAALGGVSVLVGLVAWVNKGNRQYAIILTEIRQMSQHIETVVGRLDEQQKEIDAGRQALSEVATRVVVLETLNVKG